MFVNFSNHESGEWSKEQLEAAQEYGKIVDIRFPMVNPNSSETEIEELAQNCVERILSFHPTVVMCQGEFTLCYAVIKKLKDNGIKCVAACSVREANVELQKDGSSKRVSVFKFCKFRRYE